MKNIYIPLLVVILSCTTLLQAQTYKADIAVTRQEQNQWCWCACSKAIMDYYGTVKNQCEITEYVRTKLTSTFGTTNCCTSPSGKCNNPNNLSGNGSIQDAIRALGKLESAELGALSTAQVETEMKGGRPFVMAVYWTSGGGHAVTMCAYNKSQNSFTYMDPWQSNGMVTQQFSTKIQGGAGNWQGSLIITTPHVGVDAINAVENYVTVYPNPSQGELTVNTELLVKAINVFNATGQLVKHYPAVSSSAVQLKLSAGFYNVQVVTDKGIANKKIVVE